MDLLRAQHLFYDGPAPAAERHCVVMGGADRYHAMADEAEERYLESMLRSAARSMASRRQGLAPADLQNELKRFRRMALACRARQSPSPR
jgi:hypothetical protein